MVRKKITPSLQNLTALLSMLATFRKSAQLLNLLYLSVQLITLIQFLLYFEVFKVIIGSFVFSIFYS